MQALRPISVGTAALKAMQCTKNWYTHSVFSNGFHVTDGKRLVFIGLREKGEIPFGIHFSEENFRKISLSTSANFHWSQENHLLSEELNCAIIMDQSQAYDGSLNQMPFSEERLCTWRKLFYKHQPVNGLSISIEEFLQLNAIQKIISRNPKIIEEGIRYFIGRGSGLTPSGDDFLVGCIAMDTTGRFLSSSFYEILNRLIEIETLTTDVAREYLYYALHHQFSRQVLDTLYFLCGKHSMEQLHFIWKKLLLCGHTSGADVAIGIMTGIYFLGGQENE